MRGCIADRWFRRELQDAIDILLVAFVIYRILLLIKGTRAFQILLGLLLDRYGPRLVLSIGAVDLKRWRVVLAGPSTVGKKNSYLARLAGNNTCDRPTVVRDLHVCSLADRAVL